MIDRLRAAIAQHSTHYPADFSAVVALIIGLAFLFDAAPTEARVLTIGALYIIGGFAAIVAARVAQFGQLQDWLAIFMALLTAVALVIAPSVWTLALMAALIVTMLMARTTNSQTALIWGGLMIAGAVIGMIMSDGGLLPRLLLFITGQAAILLLLPVSDAKSISVDSTMSRRSADLAGIGKAVDTSVSAQLKTTADSVADAAKTINQMTTQQVTGAGEQTQVVNLATSMLDEFLALSERSDEQARSITQLTQSAIELSRNGQSAIKETVGGMQTIREQVATIAQTITSLVLLTQRVDEIISSVSEIATQSNLLALNASIEAARAGIHGRGFAVVADEVRTLSQQSTQASRQVRAILVEIQNAMRETVRATELGIQSVDSGMDMTEQVDTMMVQMAVNVTKTHTAVRSFYDVVKQQSEGLEQIAIAIERINRISQQTMTSTRSIESLSTGLAWLASELQENISKTPIDTTP